MTLLNTVAIAIALAMDAFAVSIAAGVTLKQVSLRQTFRLSWHFGLFQAMMPVIGWAAGLSVRHYMERYAHWVAFFLLGFVGINMIREACKSNDDGADPKDPTRGLTMVVLSVATSIDALAVGLSLSMINVSIWLPAVIIGIVACAFTIVGMHLGRKLGGITRLSRYAGIIGGVVLLLIGVNILREHGVFTFS
jgi:putative Mn2+ efflux pump MntP